MHRCIDDDQHEVRDEVWIVRAYRATIACHVLAPLPRVISIMTSEPSSSVAVVVQHGQLGAVAATAIRAGDTVIAIDGLVVTAPNRYTLQIAVDQHVEAQPLPSSPYGYTAWRFLNHSCAPNTRLVGRDLTANVDIAAGDFLTFDYETTEWDMAAPFLCRCGAPACRGLIRGYRHLSETQREALRWTSPYLRQMTAAGKLRR
jgi:anti-sigma factor RsiW